MTNGGQPPQPPPGQYPPQPGQPGQPPQPPQPPPGQYPQQPGQPPGQYPPAGYGAPAQPRSPQGQVLAHWWKRVVAAIIDAFVVGIPGSIVVALIGVGAFAASDVEVDPVTGEVTSGEGGFIATFVLTPLLIWIFILAYQTYFNGNERGQTVGKMVMKLQVRDEATGGPIGYGKAALRGFVGLILGILCYIPGIIDILFPLWDAKRQTLHDKAANSLVIDLNP